MFIELVCKDGGTLVSVKGTGFVVIVPVPEVGSDKSIDYLVTNRHVALCWDGERHPMEIQSVSIRGNLKNGSSVTVPLTPRWSFPNDDSVDLAVCPLGPSEEADVLGIPISMFATKDIMTSRNVVEGSKILFTGFFYQFPGQRKIQPIVREGILAMVPDEPLTTTTGKPGTVYLGDVHIFHGNSGSPVFVNINSDLTKLALPDFRFLGVVSGNFSEDQDFNLQIDLTVKGTQHANSGIAIIVPADAVKALIVDDPVLKGEREALVRAAIHSQ